MLESTVKRHVRAHPVTGAPAIDDRVVAYSSALEGRVTCTMQMECGNGNEPR